MTTNSDGLATLTGHNVPAEGVTLRVVATDRDGLFFTQRFQVTVRGACWFAVTAPGESGGQLSLFDALSESPEAVPLEHNVDVYDFRFSPDGRWLAYRYDTSADGPRGGSLSIVDLSNLSERDAAFGVQGKVTNYAWSPSSQFLAAAFVEGDVTSLGAVRLPTEGSEDSLTSLTPTRANVDSGLSWVDERYVVFHGPDSSSALRDVYYAQLGATGFQAPTATLLPVPLPLSIASNPQGFFVLSPENVSFHGLENDNEDFEDHPWHSLVSPSGRVTAVVNDHQKLEVRSAADSQTVVTSAETCPQILAASPKTDRIACVADVPLPGGGLRGEIRFFDAEETDFLPLRVLGGFCEEDSSETGEGSCLRGRTGYSFGQAYAAGTPRAFSGSGSYFAFARGVSDRTYIYWTDLRNPMPKLDGVVSFSNPEADAPITVLRFSHDERFLFVQRGTRLAMTEFLTGEAVLVSPNALRAPPCSEDPINPAFCGNPDRPGALESSADSLATANRVSGGVRVVDLSGFPRAVYAQTFTLPTCGSACVGDFAFQPEIATDR